MGGKSIAHRAASFKSRHTHVDRQTQLNPETEINVNTKEGFYCVDCGYINRYTKFLRCPMCKV